MIVFIIYPTFTAAINFRFVAQRIRSVILIITCKALCWF
jgi:hypothetical protein